MKEEWLFPNAIVPVDVETTAALVAEIHRLIGVVGGMALAQPEQEPVACERCKQLEEQAYDLVGELRVANIKLSMRPQRKPLTHKEIWNAIRPLTQSDAVCMSLVQISMDEYRAIEAAHGIKGEA